MTNATIARGWATALACADGDPKQAANLMSMAIDIVAERAIARLRLEQAVAAAWREDGRASV